MNLLRLVVVFGMTLLATEARFIDRSVLSEGHVVLHSVLPNENEITDVKVLPEIDTTAGAVVPSENEITDVKLLPKKDTTTAEDNVNAEIPLQQPKDISTIESTDGDGKEVIEEKLVEKVEEKVEEKIGEKVSPIIEIDDNNKLEESINSAGQEDVDDKVKDTIILNNQLTTLNDIENTTSFEEKLIEISTTQATLTKLEDATQTPESTLTVSATIAPPSVDFYKPLKPFFFPPPLPSTMLLSKPLLPASPPSTYPFNELATSESVVGLGLVLLPNPFYYKKPTEEHVHASTATSTEHSQSNTNIGNGIYDNKKKLQFNPIYFYLDSNHVQHALSQYAGDANKESSWVPPFMLYANKNISPRDDKFINKLDAASVKDTETQTATTFAEPIAPLNEQSVLFAVEIPQPIYKMFKSLISLFSL